MVSYSSNDLHPLSLIFVIKAATNMCCYSDPLYSHYTLHISFRPIKKKQKKILQPRVCLPFPNPQASVVSGNEPVRVSIHTIINIIVLLSNSPYKNHVCYVDYFLLKKIFFFLIIYYVMLLSFSLNVIITFYIRLHA